MAVHSNQLAIGVLTVAGAFTTIYTAPAGKRTILKDLVLISGAAAPGIVAAAVLSGASGVALLWDAAAAQNKVNTLQGRFAVLNAGDHLQVAVGSVAGGGLQYLASGAELDL